MAKQIQLRRGTTTQHANFVGAEGEVTVDTTRRTLRVHDGTTPGGMALARSLDLDNADYITVFQRPTADNNYTWYRRYKTGWVEQGGIWNGSMACASGSAITPGVSLPVLMKDTNYFASASTIDLFLVQVGQYRTRDFVTFRMGAYTVARTLESFTWYVCGMMQL